MEWEGLLQKLIDLVEQTAPELWRIALQQVRVEAARDLVFMVALFLLIAASWAGIRWCWKQADADDARFSVVTFLGVVILAAAMMLVHLANNLVGYIINPEYYAIKVLMDLVK